MQKRVFCKLVLTCEDEIFDTAETSILDLKSNM